ncbi:MAG: hypothetical protein GY810_17900 [Aureispira sp.]|nr:hypothetical protein [Aureispira sp.]
MKTLSLFITCIVIFIGLSSFSNRSVVSLETKSTFEGVQIEWTVVASNYDYYEIQRSVDGKEYQTIDLLDSEKAVENYFDRAPNNGKNYYRVKFVKINKLFDYSETIKVKYNDLRGLVVAPKILDGELIVESITDHKPNLIRVLDVDGAVVKTFTRKDIKAQYEILDCKELEAGSYSVNVFCEGVYKKFNVEKLY